MAYNRHQFQDLIERTLREIGLYSAPATQLLLGTAAQESKFGTYLKQINGPALGAFQIEKVTFYDLRGRYSNRFPVVKGRKFEELEWDLRLSIIMARLKYYSSPLPLPAADDVRGSATIWKQVYNTPKGSGTVAEYLANYNRYVAYIA